MLLYSSYNRKIFKGYLVSWFMPNHAKISPESRKELIGIVRHEIELDLSGGLERYTNNGELGFLYGVSDKNITGYLGRSSIPTTRLDYRKRRILEMAAVKRNKAGTGRTLSEEHKQKISASEKGRKVSKEQRLKTAVTRGYSTPERQQEMISAVRHEIMLYQFGEIKEFTLNSELTERYGMSEDAVLYHLRRALSKKARIIRTRSFSSRPRLSSAPHPDKLSNKKQRELVDSVRAEIERSRLGGDVIFTNNPDLEIKYGVSRKTLVKYLALGLPKEDLTYRAGRLIAQVQTGRVRTLEEREKIASSRKGRFTGENNPNFNGWSSIEPYSLYFMFVMRSYIRERDGHTCQKCGGPENGSAHDVHHVDYDKDNDDERNLLLLCKRCHVRTNPTRNREYWAGVFRELISQVYTRLSETRYQELQEFKGELEKSIKLVA